MRSLNRQLRPVSITIDVDPNTNPQNHALRPPVPPYRHGDRVAYLGSYEFSLNITISFSIQYLSCNLSLKVPYKK
jgi:hypothetical protein